MHRTHYLNALQIFDDVVRKQKPATTPYQYREQLELDSTKSKKSLAEVYEEEFVKMTQACCTICTSY